MEPLQELLVNPSNSGSSTSNYQLLVFTELPQLHDLFKVDRLIGLVQENEVASRKAQHRFDGLRRTNSAVVSNYINLGIDSSDVVEHFWNCETRLAGMHDGEDVYYVTDTSVAALAETLSRTSPPLLLTPAPAHTSDDGVLLRSVTVTDTGRAVLSAQLDRIAVCGIDRWLGGVHLQSGANRWRWDDVHQRITEA